MNPSGELYMHIGDTAILFFSSRLRIFRGENNFVFAASSGVLAFPAGFFTLSGHGNNFESATYYRKSEGEASQKNKSRVSDFGRE
jgi:hypothetical protein